MRLINVLVLPTGDAAPYTVRIDSDDYLAQVAHLVDGRVGSCGLPAELRQREYYAFCDDDGMVRPDRPTANRFAHQLGHARLAGTVVVIRNVWAWGDQRRMAGVRRADVAFLETFLAQAPTVDALESVRQEEAWWAQHPTGVAVLDMETWKWQ